MARGEHCCGCGHDHEKTEGSEYSEDSKDENVSQIKIGSCNCHKLEDGYEHCDCEHDKGECGCGHEHEGHVCQCEDDESNSNISDEKLSKYFDVTGRALEKVKIAEAKYVKIHFQKAAEDFLDMAQRYFDDAKHFADKGDKVNAFACINYAHGWLDAGARLGLFDVEGDNQLFTVDKDGGLEIFKVADDEGKDEEVEYDSGDDSDDEASAQPNDGEGDDRVLKNDDDFDLTKSDSESAEDDDFEDPDPYGLRF